MMKVSVVLLIATAVAARNIQKLGICDVYDPGSYCEDNSKIIKCSELGKVQYIDCVDVLGLGANCKQVAPNRAECVPGGTITPNIEPAHLEAHNNHRLLAFTADKHILRKLAGHQAHLPYLNTTFIQPGITTTAETTELASKVDFALPTSTDMTLTYPASGGLPVTTAATVITITVPESVRPTAAAIDPMPTNGTKPRITPSATPKTNRSARNFSGLARIIGAAMVIAAI